MRKLLFMSIHFMCTHAEKRSNEVASWRKLSDESQHHRKRNLRNATMTFYSVLASKYEHRRTTTLRSYLLWRAKLWHKFDVTRTLQGLWPNPLPQLPWNTTERFARHRSRNDQSAASGVTFTLKFSPWALTDWDAIRVIWRISPRNSAVILIPGTTLRFETDWINGRNYAELWRKTRSDPNSSPVRQSYRIHFKGSLTLLCLLFFFFCFPFTSFFNFCLFIFALKLRAPADWTCASYVFPQVLDLSSDSGEFST